MVISGQFCKNLDLQQPKSARTDLNFRREKVSFTGFRHFTTAFEAGQTNSLKLVILGPFSGQPALEAATSAKTRTYSNLNVPGSAESARFARFRSFSPLFDRFACLPPRNGSGLFRF